MLCENNLLRSNKFAQVTTIPYRNLSRPRINHQLSSLGGGGAAMHHCTGKCIAAYHIEARNRRSRDLMRCDLECCGHHPAHAHSKLIN